MNSKHLPVLQAALTGACLLAVAPALAADGAAGPSEALFVIQVLALLIFGRLLGEGMQRIGQPALMGQLLCGLVLGPSVLGLLWPWAQHALFPPDPQQKAMLEGVAQFGVLLILLLTGMEADLAFVMKVRRAAASVSITGIAIPFLCGFALGEALPTSLVPNPAHRLVTALFLGTCLSISSVKIVAVIVREMNFVRRKIGQVIIASAIIDDTIGWLIIAMTFSVALHGSVDFVSIGKSLAGTIIFLAIAFTVGRRAVFLAIRWTNDSFVSEMPVISTILGIMGLLALVTYAIGVHEVLGAFIAGVLVGQSPILTRRIEDQLRGLINSLFMPVFFGMAGLSADLTILKSPLLIGLTAGLVLIASIGKFSGAFIGGWIGGLSRRECLALACGMNARGSTEVIVATIGLSIGALSEQLYTMIVAMAIITTLCMPPMLRWALGRVPIEEEERKRLEREEMYARSFLGNVERVLAAVDTSSKGSFASRLVGLIAGPRNIPVTVLHIEEHETFGSGEAMAPEIVKAGAAGARPTAGSEEDSTEEVDVILRAAGEEPHEEVLNEARKGYDLLVVGVERTVSRSGGLDPAVAKIIGHFDGPVAIAAARGRHSTDPLQAPLDILVPVSGTQVSQRGAEFALALAKAADAPVLALYVASERERREARRNRARGSNAEATLRQVTEMAKQMEVEIRTAVRVNVAPEDAILRQARLGDHNLIVLGANSRAGETRSYGEVAMSVLEASDRSVLLISD